jgi:hypothetical protein
MNQLSELLPLLLRHVGDSEEARQQSVLAGWTLAAGHHLRRVTAAMRLERKTLLVAVRDATWRAQLTRFSGQALFKLNSILGAPLVTAIEFVINPEEVERHNPEPDSSQVIFTAPDEQAAALRAQADAISNPQIRASFLRAAGKCLERRAR